MPTFPEWERITLEEAYEYVDYVSLHNYYGNKEDDTADFFAMTLDLEHFLHSVISTCDYVRAVKRSKKQINLSFDEWNVWYHTIDSDNEKMAREPWDRHPHLLEDHYNFEDAILNGLILITFLRHADRVKIACLAQLVNVIAPIMTEDDGPAWRQTIFYPFLHASKYGRGYALNCPLTSGKHDTSKHDGVTDVDAVAVYDEEKGEVTVFAVNRNIDEDVEFSADLRSFENASFIEHIGLISDDLKAENSAKKENVAPVNLSGSAFDGGILETKLKKSSWNVIRFSV